MERDLYEFEALEKVGLTTEAVDHCTSCHYDYEEFGYWMNGVTFADGREAVVCCGVAEYLWKNHPDALEGPNPYRKDST